MSLKTKTKKRSKSQRRGKNRDIPGRPGVLWTVRSVRYDVSHEFVGRAVTIGPQIHLEQVASVASGDKGKMVDKAFLDVGTPPESIGNVFGGWVMSRRVARNRF